MELLFVAAAIPFWFCIHKRNKDVGKKTHTPVHTHARIFFILEQKSKENNRSKSTEKGVKIINFPKIFFKKKTKQKKNFTSSLFRSKFENKYRIIYLLVFFSYTNTICFALLFYFAFLCFIIVVASSNKQHTYFRRYVLLSLLFPKI